MRPFAQSGSRANGRWETSHTPGPMGGRATLCVVACDNVGRVVRDRGASDVVALHRPERGGPVESREVSDLSHARGDPRVRVKQHRRVLGRDGHLQRRQRQP